MGAKKNRVLNVTILVAAGQTVTIPVSCVEQRRWSWSSHALGSAARLHFSRGRAQEAAQLSENLKVSGDPQAEQGEVWEAIATKAFSLGVESPTGDMGDIYEKAGPDLEAYRRQLRPQAGRRGAVFAVGGRVAGLDLFAAPGTLEKLWGKLAAPKPLALIRGGPGGCRRPAPAAPTSPKGEHRWNLS